MSNEKNLINPILFNAQEKTPDEKEYIILYYIDGDDGISQCFSRVTSRVEAYIDISNMIKYYDNYVFIDTSIVLVETKQTQTKTGNEIYFLTHPNDSLSIRKFIEFCNKTLPEEILKEYAIEIDGRFDDEEKFIKRSHVDNETNWYKKYMNTEEDFYSETFINQNDNNENNV